MRTYLILRDKARRFAEDPEIAEALAAACAGGLRQPTLPEGTDLASLRRRPLEPGALAHRGYGHERLDQLVTELLLGVR